MRQPPTLYVHTPFCRAKCSYCAFFSEPVGPGGPDASALARFLAALETEMSLQAPAWADNFALGPAPSLFFGGGTPSLLGPEGLARVFDLVRERFPLAPGAEITMEANPDSAGPELLRTARALGVNRLSLGVQSLDDRALAALGRVHDARQAMDAFHDARAAGFDNIGLDLIFGLPGQTPESWLATLRQAVALEPEHLSCYGLTIEPGTPLAADAATLAALPDEDAQAEMFLRGGEFLEAEGFAQYEISNFARPGRQCRHNLACWQGRDVLGFGPAAVSTMTSAAQRPAQAWRWANPASFAAWEALVLAGNVGQAGREELSAEVRGREALMLGLRTADGLDLAAHMARTGADLRSRHPQLLEQLGQAGLVTLSPQRLRLTRAGMLVSNSIIRALGFEEGLGIIPET
ncbi:radical SAM family heme chaperone HemW [Humidesulfovibrio idahonensis]